MEKTQILSKELKIERKTKITEIGPRLQSRVILKVTRRTRFDFRKLVTKKLPDVVQWVRDAMEALQRCEIEIYEWRHRHKKVLDTVKQQAIHEINVRLESENINRGNDDVMEAYKGMRDVIRGLKG